MAHSSHLIKHADYSINAQCYACSPELSSLEDGDRETHYRHNMKGRLNCELRFVYVPDSGGQVSHADSRDGETGT